MLRLRPQPCLHGTEAAAMSAGKASNFNTSALLTAGSCKQPAAGAASLPMGPAACRLRQCCKQPPAAAPALALAAAEHSTWLPGAACGSSPGNGAAAECCWRGWQRAAAAAWRRSRAGAACLSAYFVCVQRCNIVCLETCSAALAVSQHLNDAGIHVMSWQLGMQVPIMLGCVNTQPLHLCV